MRSWRNLLLAAIVACAGLGACAEDGGDGNGERQPRAETVDPLGELAAGWSKHVNPTAGLAIGVPPGWGADRRGTTSVLFGPDRLTALTIGADRTREGLELPLDRFARTAFRALATRSLGPKRGYRELDGGPPRRFGHRYRAVAISGAGVNAKTGVREELLLAVVRRDRLATYTLLARRNAERPSLASPGELRDVIRTLRGRPVG